MRTPTQRAVTPAAIPAGRNRNAIEPAQSGEPNCAAFNSHQPSAYSNRAGKSRGDIVISYTDQKGFAAYADH
jgi:hypothetical protein